MPVFRTGILQTASARTPAWQPGVPSGSGRATVEEGLPCVWPYPGKVLETADSGWNRVAKVQFGGVTRQVYLDFVPEAGVGDYVLVHVGFAVSKVDEAEAKRTYELLEQMGALEEEQAGATPPE